MIVIHGNVQENNGIPFGDLQSDLFEERISTGIKHHASILGWTDEMVHQDRYVMDLMDIRQTSDKYPLAVESDKTKQAPGKL